MGSEWNQWSGRAQEGNASQKRWCWKKLCCPSSSDALCIGLQVVSFLNCELRNGQPEALNKCFSVWLANFINISCLWNEAVLFHSREEVAWRRRLYYQLWLGEKRNCIWAYLVCISLWGEFQKYFFMSYLHFFKKTFLKKTLSAMIVIVVSIIFE